MCEYFDMWYDWEPGPCPYCGVPWGWQELLRELDHLRNRGALARVLNIPYTPKSEVEPKQIDTETAPTGCRGCGAPQNWRVSLAELEYLRKRGFWSRLLDRGYCPVQQAGGLQEQPTH